MNKAIRPQETEANGSVLVRTERPLPGWYDEVASALVYASNLVCSGNLRDLFPDPTGLQSGPFSSLEETIWRILEGRGIAGLLLYDPVDGLRIHSSCDGALADILEQSGIPLERPASSLAHFAAVHRHIATLRDVPLALLVDYTSHLARPEGQEVEEFFVAIDKTARLPLHRRPANTATALHSNPTIWLTDRPGDLPDWFVVGNANLREIGIEPPNIEDRFAFALRLAKTFATDPAISEGERLEALQRFAFECDGETLVTMRQIAMAARAEGLGLSDLTDAVRNYRTGTQRNPWTSPLLRTRVRQAQKRLGSRIKGQPFAINKTVDILARATMGLSGAQDSCRHRRPRGVLFLAGPTGVGKTELAKSVTDLLFGDDTACHRFDMSEFIEESSIARLIGAPPGHPGHHRGGELVNAVQRRPFSVFLFDEVEKAHPRILDTFLQILDEGRLTDARGSTGYFSESLIIFTSNIGMFSNAREDNMGMDVMPSDTHARLEDRISKAVHDHFRYELRRPEIINRIGQNIVVFDFLKYDSLSTIFDMLVERVTDTVAAEHRISVVLADGAREALRALCTHDVFDGGRGVGNRLEAHFVNPLARAIFEGCTGDRLAVTGIEHLDGCTKLQISPDTDLAFGEA